MIHWFKTLRQAVQMTQGFVPLGDWKQPNAATWDGFARLSREGEGLMILFRNESPVKAIEIKLPAFPDGNYHLRAVNGTHNARAYTGQQFRDGIEIPLPSGHRIDIFEIRLH
jgi:alpha-galactosidase